jgi:hypothetical protein
MEEERWTIRFDDVSSRTANDASRTLGDVLRVVDGVSVERAKESDDSLDFGGTLVLVLGTPAIVAVAKAIAGWATRRNMATISVLDQNGHLVARNVDSKDAAAIIEAFKKRT